MFDVHGGDNGCGTEVNKTESKKFSKLETVV